MSRKYLAAAAGGGGGKRSGTKRTLVRGIKRLIRKAEKKEPVQQKEFDRVLNRLNRVSMPILARTQAENFIRQAQTYLLEAPAPFYAGYEPGAAKWCLTRALKRVEPV